MTTRQPRIALTAGEPAGIGPDLCLMLAGQQQAAGIVVVADPDLLTARAAQLQLPFRYRLFDETSTTVSPAGDELCILAEDQGPGIPDPQELLSSARPKKGNTGVGLAGSQRLARTFEIESTPGRGTQVTATLPLP